MRPVRTTVVLVLVCLGLDRSSASAPAQTPPPGATCTVKAFKKDGKAGGEFKFKATRDGKVTTMDGKPLGSFAKESDGFTLTIANAPKHNGSYRFVKHPKVPKGWLAPGAGEIVAYHLTVAGAPAKKK